MLTDKGTDEVKDVHMVGPRAPDIVGEATLATEFQSAAEVHYLLL